MFWVISAPLTILLICFLYTLIGLIVKHKKKSSKIEDKIFKYYLATGLLLLIITGFINFETVKTASGNAGVFFTCLAVITNWGKISDEYRLLIYGFAIAIMIAYAYAIHKNGKYINFFSYSAWL